MSGVNVLIVEDEQIVAMEIEGYVSQLGYKVVDICMRGEDALKTVAKKDVSIILMDIQIEGEIDGIETAGLITDRYPDIQIIFLTAHMDEYNIERAVELNPVAYLAKPFRREELNVFMRIASKKFLAHKGDDQIINQDKISFDSEFSYIIGSRELRYCGESIYLTKKEGEMLDLFVRNQNMIIDMYTIENRIWPEKSANPNTIRTLIRRLREKMNYKFIETVPKAGYRFVSVEIAK